MFRPVELFIGLRYTRAKRRNHFISFISLISMLGIALGIMALVTVLSVMNGFEKELRERILGVVAHATVSGIGGILQDWRPVLGEVEQHSNVVGAAPFIRAEGMLSYDSTVAGTVLRGVLPEKEGSVSNLDKKMLAGSLDQLQAGKFGIILGKDLALSLGIGIGDKITLITSQTTVTAAGILPRLKRFTLIGIFEAGMYEYDSALALIHLDDAATLFRFGDGVSGIRLKLDDMFLAPQIARQLLKEIDRIHVSDWTRQHANFFRAVRMEKTVMFVILLLIVAVAAFNIVSTLVMMVTDKESDIAILRTLGISPRSIMAIFMVQGGVIGTIGTLIGTVAGVLLALNVETLVPMIESLFDMKFLAADVYYISELPSDLRWSDVITISSLAFMITLLATIYPAWRAAGTHPAEALRYE